MTVTTNPSVTGIPTSGGSSSGLTIGTTTITSGTTTSILYDNAGVVGESAILKFISPTLTITPTTAAGAVPALSVLSSGAGFVKIYDNGTMVVDSDSGTGTVPLLLKYNGAAVHTFTYQGIAQHTGALSLVGTISTPSGALAIAPSTSITNITGALNASTTIKAGGFTVATLPAGATGQIVYVTDQLTTVNAKGVAPTAGGAVVAYQYYNGAAWVGI